MNALLVFLIVIVIYAIAYIFYGRRILHERIVQASSDRQTPAVAMYDGVDYVPANKYVLFGHHFASIAGAGPIVGPSIAMAYGWALPLLWVLFGNVFIGTVHDYLALMASVRHRGVSIMSISEMVMGRKARYLFLLYTFIALILVYAAFASIAAILFVKIPSAATMSVIFMPIALFLGVMMYRMGIDMRIASLITLVLVIGAYFYSYKIPLFIGTFAPATPDQIQQGLSGDWTAYHRWVIILGLYAILAASLPVWYLLQPRDFANSYLLFAFVGLSALGLILMANATLRAPAYTSFSPPIIQGQPTPFWPAIPLIIACGSLSGFHSLVSSGTTSKQLANELEGLFVGYGAMLTEGALSTMAVIIPISLAWDAPEAVAKLQDVNGDGQVNLLDADKVVRFTIGYGYMLGKALSKLGLAYDTGFAAFKLFSAIALVLFVMTTLDSATRLARFALQEMMDWTKNYSKTFYSAISNKWIASFIVVAIGTLLAYPIVIIKTGKGPTEAAAYNVVWPAFAGVNQMLAALALLTSSLWIYGVLKVRGTYVGLIMIPALFLWVTVTAGLTWWLVKVAPHIVDPIQRYGAGGLIAISLALNIVLLYLFAKGYKMASTKT